MNVSLALDIRENPFIFGRPVPPEKCVGRERLAQRVLERLLSGGSCALYGERRVGKSSFLFYLKAVGEQSAATRERLRFGYLDAQSLAYSGDNPQEFTLLFWRTVLQVLAANPALEKHLTGIEVEPSQPGQIANVSALMAAFDAIARENQRAVLLLDELEYVLDHIDHSNPSLLYSLRSLAGLASPGLILTTVSRQPLNEALAGINLGGSSPFQNIFAFFPVEDFTEVIAKRLLDTYLKDTGVVFTAEERQAVFESAEVDTSPDEHGEIRYDPERIQFAAWKVFDEKGMRP